MIVWPDRVMVQVRMDTAEVVGIEGDIESFTETVWTSLNEENKVSLFVRFIDRQTGETQTRIVNKNVD